MTIRRREILLTLSSSLWGLAIAISLAEVFARPPHPGQLPGLAKDIGIDAHAPMRFFLFLILVTIAMPFVLRPLLRRLEDAQAWARRTAMTAPVVALWFTLVTHAPLWTIIPCALTLVACLALRNYRAEFTRHDMILLPVWLAVLFAMIDIAPEMSADRIALVAAMLVLALRLAIARMPSPLPPALAFAASPLAFVPMTGFFARDQRYFGWHGLAIAILTPPVLRLVLRNRQRVLRALALVIYPIFVYAYTNATTLETAEGKPRINMFENAHMLLPASEMLHGEKLYRDILPAHGMMEDGFFDFLAMRLRGPNIANALRARVTIGCLNAIALYALGAAMTGSAEAGLATFFLGAITGTIAPSTIRFLPAIFTLAMTAHAVRRRNAKWLGYAARGVVIAGMFSLDFAFYAAVALLVATLRFRPIKPALKQVLIGVVATGIPFFILLAILGIAGDFVRGTLFEVLPLSEVYAMDLFDSPAGFRGYPHVPEVLIALFHRTSWFYMLWVIALMFTAAALMRKASRRLEPMVVVGVFIVIGAISYAERHHLHFAFVVGAFLAGAAWLLLRARSPFAPAAVVIALILGVPTSHIAVVSWLRHSRGPLDPGWVEIKDLPRARGVFIPSNEAGVVDVVRRYIDKNLRPDETFFDFTNRGLLYFLLDRDCPIRQYEVAFYETEEKQREVITRLQRDPRVVMAIVPSAPNDGTSVDDVSNTLRAPLVWKYLQENFEPATRDGDVVIWKRRGLVR